MNKKVLWIVGGCAVLLLLCCVAIFVVYFVFKDTIQQQILGSLSTGVELPLGTVVPELPSVVPPSLGRITPGAVPTVGALPTSKAASSASSTGNPFLDALTKAKSATKYRVEFSMAFGGMENKVYKETPFIAFNGEVDGKNSHIIPTGGLLSSLYTGSETGKLEIVDVGGTEYLKGASSLMGVIKLDPNTWYISNDSSSSSFASFAKPDEFSSWTGTSFSDMKKVRSESLDSQGCDVYLYDFKSLQNAALTGLLGTSGGQSNFDVLDRADVTVWLCGDGFVHKYILDYEGHSSKDATQKSALKMNWHVWDVNSSAINIQAPTGAKPMPTK